MMKTTVDILISDITKICIEKNLFPNNTDNEVYYYHFGSQQDRGISPVYGANWIERCGWYLQEEGGTIQDVQKAILGFLWRYCPVNTLQMRRTLSNRATNCWFRQSYVLNALEDLISIFTRLGNSEDDLEYLCDPSWLKILACLGWQGVESTALLRDLLIFSLLKHVDGTSLEQLHTVFHGALTRIKQSDNKASYEKRHYIHIFTEELLCIFNCLIDSGLMTRRQPSEGLSFVMTLSCMFKDRVGKEYMPNVINAFGNGLG